MTEPNTSHMMDDENTSQEASVEGSSSNRTNDANDSDDLIVRFDPGETLETLTVGDREEVEDPDNNRPHEFEIWNASPDDRTVSVTVVRSPESPNPNIPIDMRYEIPGDNVLRLHLLEPDAYRVEIDVPATGAQWRRERSTSQFDCNSHVLKVMIDTDGSIASTQLSTTLACDE